MRTVEVKLPSLGDDAGDEATVSCFFKEPGEEIREGDDLVEMVTEKATFTVPSPVTGKLVKLSADEDDVLKVGDVLAVVEVDG
ncbi:MAG TPA: biotin/lipoyl-containing protein [Planctomycetota bacterium]|nr:biotin/lipoyl-containing protein [Planctomycetota bacterium]